MYVSLGDRVGYVPGGANIGIIRNDDTHVTIIDLKPTTNACLAHLDRLGEAHFEVIGKRALWSLR